MEISLDVRFSSEAGFGVGAGAFTSGVAFGALSDSRWGVDTAGCLGVEVSLDVRFSSEGNFGVATVAGS